jgi:hypothetical protein
MRTRRRLKFLDNALQFLLEAHIHQAITLVKYEPPHIADLQRSRRPYSQDNDSVLCYSEDECPKAGRNQFEGRGTIA